MIKGLDHVAIPMEFVQPMLDFYAGLGCRIVEEYPGILHSAYFGDNKINLHMPNAWKAEWFTLRGKSALPGCGDICFVWGGTDESLHETLHKIGADIEEGPVDRVGGKNNGQAGTSVYTRDPDGNLLEFIIYG